METFLFFIRIINAEKMLSIELTVEDHVCIAYYEAFLRRLYPEKMDLAAAQWIFHKCYFDREPIKRYPGKETSLEQMHNKMRPGSMCENKGRSLPPLDDKQLEILNDDNYDIDRLVKGHFLVIGRNIIFEPNTIYGFDMSF